MKKLIVILMILFVGILFAGCTSQQAAPTPTPTPTPTAVPTTVATPEPTTVATPNVTVATPNVTKATPTPTPTPIPDQKILISKTLTFQPQEIKIPAGTKVIFETDAIGYKFKVALAGPGFYGESQIIAPNQPWSYTFNKAGTFTVSEVITPQFRDQRVKITVT